MGGLVGGLLVFWVYLVPIRNSLQNPKRGKSVLACSLDLILRRKN